MIRFVISILLASSSSSPPSSSSSPSQSLSLSPDALFHNWCDQVGIKTPFARLKTTTESVAGRGVFAEGNVKEGDIVIQIPESLVFHEYNAAQNFPDVAQMLEYQKKSFFQNSKANPPQQEQQKKATTRWWQRLRRSRKGKNNSKDDDDDDDDDDDGEEEEEEEVKNETELVFSSQSDFWQAELTAYSIACLQSTKEEQGHIWVPWISQWQRSDPMQDMYSKGISWQDEEAIDNCVEKLHEMLPEVPKYKLKAAVHIRLGRMNELKKIFNIPDSHLDMYGVLISRAIEIGDDILGVIPMFDMINHSRQPNLGLHFNGKEFGLYALRDISHGEEFFVCYCNVETANEWDENTAVWNLVQWGIPEPSNVVVPQKALIA